MRNKRIPTGFLLAILLAAAIIAGGIFTLSKDQHQPSNMLDTSKEEQSATGSAEDDQSTNGTFSNLPEGITANNLRATDGKNGSATVVSVNDGKNFSVVIEAKLDDISEGFYTAWVYKNNEDKYMKLGNLEKKNEVWTLSYDRGGDYLSYKNLVVSYETSDDNTLETQILAGTL